MSLAAIMTISCALATITLAIFSAILFILLQSGGRGVKTLFDRFTGGGNKRKPDQEVAAQADSRARPTVKSGDVLRRKARELDFNPAAGYGAQSQSSGFSAQSAMPQQPSFRSHDPLRPPANSNQPGPFGQSGPSMPALSSSRPFQPGQEIRPSLRSSLPPNQAPLQGRGQFNPQQPPPPPDQFGAPGQFPPPPGQGTAPQPGGLPQYRPALRSQPGANADSPETGHRLRRDSRRSDDFDQIYDDGEGGGGILGDFGEMLDMDI